MAPAGALGSMPFTPEESMAALMHYRSLPRLESEYGLADSYNLNIAGGWVAPGVIGINKGISLVMIENHLTGLVWSLFMANSFVREGLRLCGVVPVRS
jgi:hypothetical protein